MAYLKKKKKRKRQNTVMEVPIRMLFVEAGERNVEWSSSGSSMPNLLSV